MLALKFVLLLTATFVLSCPDGNFKSQVEDLLQELSKENSLVVTEQKRLDKIQRRLDKTRDSFDLFKLRSAVTVEEFKKKMISPNENLYRALLNQNEDELSGERHEDITDDELLVYLRSVMYGMIEERRFYYPVSWYPLEKKDYPMDLVNKFEDALKSYNPLPHTEVSTTSEDRDDAFIANMVAKFHYILQSNSTTSKDTVDKIIAEMVDEFRSSLLYYSTASKDTDDAFIGNMVVKLHSILQLYSYSQKNPVSVFLKMFADRSFRKSRTAPRNSRETVFGELPKKRVDQLLQESKVCFLTWQDALSANLTVNGWTLNLRIDNQYDILRMGSEKSIIMKFLELKYERISDNKQKKIDEESLVNEKWLNNVLQYLIRQKDISKYNYDNNVSHRQYCALIYPTKFPHFINEEDIYNTEDDFLKKMLNFVFSAMEYGADYVNVSWYDITYPTEKIKSFAREIVTKLRSQKSLPTPPGDEIPEKSYAYSFGPSYLLENPATVRKQVQRKLEQERLQNQRMRLVMKRDVLDEEDDLLLKKQELLIKEDDLLFNNELKWKYLRNNDAEVIVSSLQKVFHKIRNDNGPDTPYEILLANKIVEAIDDKRFLDSRKTLGYPGEWVTDKTSGEQAYENFTFEVIFGAKRKTLGYPGEWEIDETSDEKQVDSEFTYEVRPSVKRLAIRHGVKFLIDKKEVKLTSDDVAYLLRKMLEADYLKFPATRNNEKIDASCRNRMLQYIHAHKLYIFKGITPPIGKILK